MIITSKFFPSFYPAKRGVIVIIMSVVCRLSTFSCEHDNSTKFYPILMKLHRIVFQWIRKNPIDFCHDDVISDVISGKIGLWACEHDNSSKSYPILMKLHRIVP